MPSKGWERRKRDPMMAGLLTPQEARELLEMSRQAFRYHVKLGAVTYVWGADGVRYFRRAEILEFCARRGQQLGKNGQIAAAVFQAFDEGLPLHRIVATLHVPPEEVRRLYRQYVTPVGSPVPTEREELRAAKKKAAAEAKQDDELERMERDWAARQGWPKERAG